MLYSFFHRIALFAIKLFFNTVTVENKERALIYGPVIFVANHPNFFMDPLIAGTFCPRTLHFFAKSTLFNTNLKKKILTKLNLVPIYRKIDNQTNMDKNMDTFEKGYEILEKNGAFLIFPEGISKGKRVLEKIKTGTARIGFGAEVKNNFSLDVVIIPIGLSYSDLVRFRSNVMVRFGNPINLADFEEEYRNDQFATVRKITENIETALNKLTNYIPTEEIKDIVEGLELIYKMELMTEMGLELDNKKDDFLVTKMLTNAVKWYQDKNPEKVTQFREKLKNYLSLLKELNIRDEFLDPARQKKRGWNRTKTILFLIAGFPLFMWGILTNYPPYKLPRLIVKWFHDFQVEEASWKMMYGMVFFIVYYGFGIGIVWYLTRDLLWVGIFTISLIPSGNFALYYSKSINKYRQHVKFLSIFYQKRSIIFQIIEERMTIMRFLKNAKDEYIESVQLEA